MPRKRGSLTLSNYGKKRSKKKTTTRREKTPEAFEIACIVNDRLEQDPYKGEFKVRWKGYGEEDDSWVSFESMMTGEWNCAEAVIDYLNVRYEGEKVLLVEKEDDGRTRYSVVDKTLQLEWIKSGELQMVDESVPEPPPKEPTPAPPPSVEVAPNKAAAKRTATDMRRSSQRIRGKRCKRLGLREHRPSVVEHRYSTRAQSARKEIKETTLPAASRKRKQDLPDDSSDDSSIQFIEEIPGSFASPPSKPVTSDKRGRPSLPSISSHASSPEIPFSMVLTVPRPFVHSRDSRLTQEQEDQLRSDLAYSDTSDEEDGAGRENDEITDHDEPRVGKERWSPSTWMYHVAHRPPFNSDMTRLTYQECLEELPGVLEAYLRFVLDGEMQRKERMLREEQEAEEKMRAEVESVSAVAGDPEGHRLLVGLLDRKGTITASDQPDYQARIFRVLMRVRGVNQRKEDK